jgi:hypothetical protein
MPQNSDRLTLADALARNRLVEFIAQEESRGIGPVSVLKFDAAVKEVATAPKPQKSEDRT